MKIMAHSTHCSSNQSQHRHSTDPTTGTPLSNEQCLWTPIHCTNHAISPYSNRISNQKKKGIKLGFYTVWLIFTIENMHTKGQWQHLRLMPLFSNTHSDGDTNNNKNSPNPGEKHTDVYTSRCEAKQVMYTDQTGCFPYVSSKGNQYLMIVCKLNSNFIDCKPMRGATQEMTRA